MASFIAKQMVGNQLKNVTDKAGGAGGDDEKKEGAEGEGEGTGEVDPEIAEARREAEERRKDKHRKMEEERETVRQSIRDKYGLKKKEEEKPMEPEDDPDMAGRLGRKKKTPAEMAAEQNPDEEDESESSMFPANVSEFGSKVQELPGKVGAAVSEASEKCVLQ